MIQFNLLPDIKMQYIKARRQEHLVIFASTVAIIAAVAVFVVLIVIVDVVQKKQLSDLHGNISTYGSDLQNTQNFDQILTLQNQLASLPALHNAKPAASRLFTYLTQLTPTAATIGQLNIDYTQNTISITGSANSLSTVNQFTDTLKFTGYSVQGQTGDHPAFSNVVLTSFGDTTATGATYTISADFNPAIFRQVNNVTLTVPGVINTRSEVAQPGVLFVQTGSQG
jgi:Tfp pilus assembly protein PilN